jgi:hypothetical protein
VIDLLTQPTRRTIPGYGLRHRLSRRQSLGSKCLRRGACTRGPDGVATLRDRETGGIDTHRDGLTGRVSRCQRQLDGLTKLVCRLAGRNTVSDR